ncbi:MAG: hypothetical protein ACNI3A_00055 [Desulfovibrio sp.]|uniref:hypothetical protein n=1 Tax=Desulfovibrio sp. 7SRBS1 TaxID=3378064 RepID=UPI003B3F3CFE
MEQFYGIAIRQAGASCPVAKDKIDGNDTPALPWVEAQQDRIQGFTAYGPAFQQRCVASLSSMREKLIKIVKK